MMNRFKNLPFRRSQDVVPTVACVNCIPHTMPTDQSVKTQRRPSCRRGRPNLIKPFRRAISGHRYYNPSLGRWPNRDPIKEFGGLNLYGYVKGNPISLIDPIGLAGLTLKYDFSGDFLVPIGTTKVTSFDEIISDVKKYTDAGFSIEKLRIGGHGKPGAFILSNDTHTEISSTTFSNYRRGLENPITLSIESNKKDFEMINKLMELSKLINDDASVEFVSCSTFDRDAGGFLFNDLQGIFGLGNVEGYYFPVKWGLFGNVYIITETRRVGNEDKVANKVWAY